MAEIEKIGGCKVLALKKFDLQFTSKIELTAIQKSSRTMTMHCTRPPSHCRRACTSSVFVSSFLACSHCSNWSRTISTFLPAGIPCPRRNAASVSLQRQIVGQSRTSLPQTVQQPCFCFPSRGFDVHGDHIVGQMGQQSRLHQRRLAATARPIDEADREGAVGIGFFDAGLPEPDTVGQSIPVSRAGQQLQKKVGVMGVKGSQAFRHNLDGLAGPKSAFSPWSRWHRSDLMQSTRMAVARPAWPQVNRYLFLHGRIAG